MKVQLIDIPPCIFHHSVFPLFILSRCLPTEVLFDRHDYGGLLLIAAWLEIVFQLKICNTPVLYQSVFCPHLCFGATSVLKFKGIFPLFVRKLNKFYAWNGQKYKLNTLVYVEIVFA